MMREKQRRKIPEKIQETARADPTLRGVGSVEAFLQMAVPVDIVALRHYRTESVKS